MFQFTKQQVQLAVRVVPMLRSQFGSTNIYRCIPLDDETLRVLIQTNEHSDPFRMVDCSLNTESNPQFPLQLVTYNADTGKWYASNYA